MLVEFGRELCPDDNRRVHDLAAKLTVMQLPGIIECVPAFGSLMVSLDPLVQDGEQLVAICREVISSGCADQGNPPLVVEIPVLYGGEFGPDLLDVSSETGLSQEEVITLHTAKPYLVYMIGFMPGYPYLGGLDQRLSVPRLKSPRTKVPAGSVAIAEQLTGIYSVNSPGGWRLIGRTPVPLYIPEENPPTLLRPGDYVRFVPVGAEQYQALEEDIAASLYVPVTYPLDGEVAK